MFETNMNGVVQKDHKSRYFAKKLFSREHKIRLQDLCCVVSHYPIIHSVVFPKAHAYCDLILWLDVFTIGYDRYEINDSYHAYFQK